MARGVIGLRVSLGVVYVAFSVLKFFPGVSPAQGLVLATTHRLSLGMVPTEVSDSAAMTLVAGLECAIGACLLAGCYLRPVTVLLLAHVTGILSPLVLLPGRLFTGPYHMPTLEGQYVIKDVVLFAAGIVVAIAARTGARTRLPS